MIPIFTNRDVTILKNENTNFIFAIDSIGGVGEKTNDIINLKIEEVAKLTTRVSLCELVSLNGDLKAIFLTSCNEFKQYTNRILNGLKEELEANDLKNISINSSSEDNFEIKTTGFGIVAFGEAKNLNYNNTQINDFIYIYGLPYVGDEVILNYKALLKPNEIKPLVKKFEINDFIPCGSRGVHHELEVLEKENNVKIGLFQGHKIDLKKSAGPATCFVFSSPLDIINEFNIIKIGKIVRKI